MPSQAPLQPLLLDLRSSLVGTPRLAVRGPPRTLLSIISSCVSDGALLRWRWRFGWSSGGWELVRSR
ncbi:hypothetical protein N665_0056s0040 [Sinapis alba]|nr:hypothetical protein N665_0056s0040 [Sinapis alba]